MLVPKSVFNLHNIADTESSRYALASVRFERDAAGAPLAIGCDGRRLLVLGWHEAPAAEYPPGPLTLNPFPVENFETLLPATEARKLATAKLPAGLVKRKPILGNIVIDEAGTNSTIPVGWHDMETATELRPCAMEGRYPRWRDVCPAYGPRNSVSVTVDARYLAELAEVIAKHATDLTSESGASVTLTISAKESHLRPVVLSAAATDGRCAYGVLMPLVGKKGKEKAAPAVVWNPNGTPEPVAEAPAEDEAEAAPEPEPFDPPFEPTAAPVAAPPAEADLAAEAEAALGPVAEAEAEAEAPAAESSPPVTAPAPAPPAEPARRKPRKPRKPRQPKPAPNAAPVTDPEPPAAEAAPADTAAAADSDDWWANCPVC